MKFFVFILYLSTHVTVSLSSMTRNKNVNIKNKWEMKAAPKIQRTVTIAVVEYRPVRNTSLTPDAKIMVNVANYVDIIKSAEQRNIDMIIFPESTLTNSPKTGAEVMINSNPCDSPTASKLTRELSCASRSSKTYLIVNLVEKEKCRYRYSGANCEKFGFFFYNTNVVFDRRGMIVDKYRKYNLFGEKNLDKPTTAEIVVIETDFGVKYGIFTCFDILFKSPAQDLLRKGVDGVIYPTMWFSQLPFLTSLQTQQMWAHTHGVKVFSAGANNPSSGSGGSGFYSGAQGMILGDIVATGGSQTYVYKYVTGESHPYYNPQEAMPYQDPDIFGKEMDGFRISQDKSITEFSSTLLDTSKADFKERLCHESGSNRLCCDFQIKTSVTNRPTNKKAYTYHLVAFTGIRNFARVYASGLEICAVIACLNSSLSSCGRRFPNYTDIAWPITFEEVTIRANFVKDENRTQYPNSLLSSIRPINASQTVWEGEEVEIAGKMFIRRRFAVRKSQNRLLTFAIFGRDFGRDSLLSSSIRGSSDTHNVGDNKSGKKLMRAMSVACYLLTAVIFLLVK